jgi:hypothetical protein
MMMFDKPLTDRGSEVSVPFSSDNPSPEVTCCLSPAHNSLDDNAFSI